MNEWLDIEDCKSLFDEHADLIHYTSALRYPVFKNGKNYSGTPSLFKMAMLKSMVDTYLCDEVVALKHAVFIPLGGPATDALIYLSEIGKINRTQILDGIPHPSGANAERIAYMLEEKREEDLSKKTRADRIDQARLNLKNRVRDLLSNS